MLGNFSEESLSVYQSIVSRTLLGDDYLGVYDFTRCVRPDGSTYGTRGRCTPPNKPLLGEAPEQPDSDGEDLPSGTKKVSVSMDGYSVNINVKGNG